MLEFETALMKEGISLIAGIDEAGRGPLAGPVVAASVIMPFDTFVEGVNDSKKLSAKKRDELFDKIRETALCCTVGIADEKVIDDINILNATKKAMLDAVNALDPVPECLLIDAVHLDGTDLRQCSVIKGDARSYSIAAASIIAKVTRDRIMLEYDKMYPEYGFASHKGYGSKAHIEALRKYGPCPIHRKLFIRNFVND